jgi:hypothetical protein
MVIVVEAVGDALLSVTEAGAKLQDDFAGNPEQDAAESEIVPEYPPTPVISSVVEPLAPGAIIEIVAGKPASVTDAGPPVTASAVDADEAV